MLAQHSKKEATKTEKNPFYMIDDEFIAERNETEEKSTTIKRLNGVCYVVCHRIN